MSDHSGEKEPVEITAARSRHGVPGKGRGRNGLLRAVRGARHSGILASARTGDVGDGKIFVQAIGQVIRIRTGERDNAALTPVTADAVQRAALQETVAAVR